MNIHIHKIIITAVIVITIAILAFFVMQKIDRYLDLVAISDCANDYRLEFTQKGKDTRIVRPLEKPFKECVWNKGVTSWQGTSQ